MQHREFGRTGWKISAIGLGTWAIGSEWGPVDERTSLATLHQALDRGVNFFDTADVYGSERLLSRLRQERRDPFYIATKAGRRLRPHVADGYNRKNLASFVEDSLRALGVEAIDLLQLHCPPTPVYHRPEVFGILDDFLLRGRSATTA